MKTNENSALPIAVDDKIQMAGPWITNREIQLVNDAMLNGWYENAYYYCERFQREFAEYHNRKYALMTPNCTSSIHLLLKCLGVGDGDEVIVPECTWIASCAPVTYLRARPVFVDIDPVSWCMDPEAVERAITPQTKAIIVVNLFGNMARMDKLQEIADRYGIHLIEDAAESIGSTFQGVRSGKFGVGSVFSFHRTKTITTGEGGMLLLDDKKIFEMASIWRDHGRRPGGPMYYNYEVTYKYMPSNVQAALGLAQFQRLDELVERKRWMWNAYRERLAGIEDIEFNPEPEGVRNSVWITGLVFGKSHHMLKNRAIDLLAALGVPARPFFYPLSSLPAFPGAEEQYRLKNPVAYDISSRAINLPGAFTLTETQIDRVCAGIRKILGK